MKKKILIVLNAVVYNRGSEALIRGLVQICKESYSDSEIYLSSSEDDFDSKLNIPNVNFYIKKYTNNKKNTLIGFLLLVIKKIFRAEKFYNKMILSNLIKVAKKMDLIIVIGADNYDSSYGMIKKLSHMNTILREKTNCNMLLYDCSLEEKDINKEVMNDLEKFDLVTVRESLTYKNFQKILPKDKLKYYPDPAFIINPEEVELPVEWKENNMLGLNLSSLITEDKYGGGQKLVLESYFNLIEYVIDNTDLNIALIPHVMKNSDLSTLRILYDKYKNTRRLILIDNEALTAVQLKYIISKCSLFVGARTHSTIAAYSSYVPTLVLGYSIKSKGIATDIFGTYNNYVISVDEIKNSMDLTNAFIWINENQEEIRNTLERVIPEYKEKVMKTSESILEL